MCSRNFPFFNLKAVAVVHLSLKKIKIIHISTVTDDGKCTCEIKSRIAMAKAAFNKKEESFYQQIGLKFEEETNEMLRLEHGSVWC